MATTIQIQIEALDKVSGKLDKIGKKTTSLSRKVGKLDKKFDGVSKSVGKLKGAFGGLGGLVAAALPVAAIGAFGKSVTDAYSRAQDLQTTLDTVTGSAKAGGEAFKFINDFAVRTPFDIETLTETFIKLKSQGIEPTEELLTTFGDVASVSTDRVGALQAMTDLWSRTLSGGVGLEDLNRLADRGIPVFKTLEEQLGITRLEISEFGKTAEGAEKIRQALATGLSQKFGGGMAEASKNLSVSLSNMGIAANNALIKVGEAGLAGAVGRAAQKLTDYLTSNDEVVTAIGKGLGDALDVAVEGFGFMIDHISRVYEVMRPLIETSLPLLEKLWKGLGWTMENVVFPAFKVVVGILTTIVDTIDTVFGAIGRAYNALKDFGGDVADFFGFGDDDIKVNAEKKVSYNPIGGVGRNSNMLSQQLAASGQVSTTTIHVGKVDVTGVDLEDAKTQEAIAGIAYAGAVKAGYRRV